MSTAHVCSGCGHSYAAGQITCPGCGADLILPGKFWGLILLFGVLTVLSGVVWGAFLLDRLSLEHLPSPPSANHTTQDELAAPPPAGRLTPRPGVSRREGR